MVRGIEEGLEGREWGIWPNYVIYVYEILSLKGVSWLSAVYVSLSNSLFLSTRTWNPSRYTLSHLLIVYSSWWLPRIYPTVICTSFPSQLGTLIST